MNNHISIDVTNAKKCAVPEEKFRIINFNVGNGNTIEDLVHNEPPYFHFQVLRPESKEQADKAINYFKEHKKYILHLQILPNCYFILVAQSLCILNQKWSQTSILRY